MNVSVVLHGTDEHVVRLTVSTGKTLLDALRSNGVAITTICRGRAICGMCRVLVQAAVPSVPRANPGERRLLDVLPGTTRDHRLACQIMLGPEHDGMTVALDEPPRHGSHP